MQTYKDQRAIEAASRADWRKWLDEHCRSESFVWLVIYKKESGVPSVYYPEAVEEALCYGWIDSKANKRDDQSFYLSFAKRKPASKWSKVNKERVEQLIKKGLMTDAGMEMIKLAKQTGTWTALEEVDNLALPADLAKLLSLNKTANANWDAFSASSKKAILQWILNAKQAATRQKRIEETVRLAEQNVKANEWKPKS
ncbi:hypothetical protein GS399_16840 [Pedobacter sp. HMF7647]|uniref:Bacteriocin-protection protein n=1 Tax=Hufsiella arboris TaxID=2695275 RepID=A0A7K1YDH7_9SPHI|nr:YdeI/OmpD-associated family protein [Hufsiella arboris]MXV52643.1 hypothetical protein [Hufsiella arboris]